jgi:hypothetical protein
MGLWACTTATTDNFKSLPGDPPASCAEVDTIEGCTGGSVGYSCSRDRPDHTDPNLVCSGGSPGANGSTLYCCAPYTLYYTDCAVDTTIVGCVANSFGLSCGGDTAPNEADASIACTPGTQKGTTTAYCCNSAVMPATCAADANVLGCGDPAIGYSCAGTDRPDGNASLACTSGEPTKEGATSFCCIPFQPAAAACQSNPDVIRCGSDQSYGFSCIGSLTPESENPALTCEPSTPATGTTETTYCCKLGS